MGRALTLVPPRKETSDDRGTEVPVNKRAGFWLGRIDPGQVVVRMADSGLLVNLAGNYDYLSRGYYLSQDYENRGERISPTCKEMLDAYVPPLFLEKGKRAGLPVPEYYISNGYFEPPVVVDPVNPFTLRGRIVLKPALARSIAKSLTRNHTYAICCQEIPDGGRVVYFNSVLGWAVAPRYREMSRAVWESYGIPLGRIRLIITSDDRLLLSDICPLFLEDLNSRELAYLSERVVWGS